MCNTEEATTSRALPSPVKPSQKMIEDHNISHIPFRSWCMACVRGRGKSMDHRLIKDKDEDQVPVGSVDYGFLGDESKTKEKVVG